MKKLFIFTLFLMIPLVLAGCDIIEREIQRAESIELEDYIVDIPNRTVYLKITSDADEQVIEDVVINDTQYDLIAQGDDWYKLEDVPIATSYRIDNVYYRTGVGVRLSFGINYDVELKEALEFLPDDQLDELTEEPLTFNGITFSLSEEELVEVDAPGSITIDEIDSWVWLILDDEVPVYAALKLNGDTYIITIPDDIQEFLK